MTTIRMRNRQVALAGSVSTRSQNAVVDIRLASQRTATALERLQDFSRRVDTTRPPAPVPLPSIEHAAADIRRLTAALKARREAAPDNLLELAALAVDLKRASVVWRQLVPTGIWA